MFIHSKDALLVGVDDAELMIIVIDAPGNSGLILNPQFVIVPCQRKLHTPL